LIHFIVGPIRNHADSGKQSAKAKATDEIDFQRHLYKLKVQGALAFEPPIKPNARGWER
jgi:hypothetical protein